MLIMKKILLFLLGLFLTSSVIGQTVSVYTFSQSSGTFTAITGGTVLGTGAFDDNVYANNPIGFTFLFRNVAYTVFSVNANGWLCMGATASSSYTPLSTGVSNNVACAIGRDLQGLANGELRYELIGTAPNRTLVLQWLHVKKYGSTGSGDDWNFQIRLNETTNVIDIVYGTFTTNTTSTTVQVGLRGATNADFNNRTTTTDWAATTAGGSNSASCTLSNTVFPASGQIFTFTPPPPPPTIAYTPLMNTSSTAPRTLTTTITSPAGIPPSGIGLPMLYWRIDAGSWTGVQANWSTGSTYNFTFGGGVVLGNVIQYYVVAQDAAVTPLLSALPSAGVGALTPNPPAAASPPTTPYSYTIVGPICGTKMVGAGGDYANLTAAVAALNGSEITCPVVFLLTASYTSAGETFPIVIQPNIGSSAINTVTIKPNTSVSPTISGSFASGALIKILNNYTIIDGSNSAGGTSRDLTITNTSATSPSVVWFGSTGTIPIIGSSLLNCIINNGVNTSSAVVISDGTTLGNAGYFNTMTISNNAVRNAYIGVYVTGGTVPQNGSNLFLTNNNLDASGTNAIRYCGLYMQGVNGVTVFGNTIANFSNTEDEDDRGIWLATGTINASVEKNIIHDISYGATGGYGAHGIAVSTGQTGANVNIINNVIYNIWGDGYNYTGSYFGDNPFGIFAFTAQTGINIYFNSINMYGAVLNHANALSAGIVLGTGTVASIKNNMIVNNLGVSSVYGYGATAIFAQSSNTQFAAGGLDYNNYYVNPAIGVKNLGMIVTTGYTTLSTWQPACGNQDMNTFNLDPLYTSNSNLLPTNASLRNKGIYIGMVTTDITGAFRTNPPDIGAYQFSPVHVVTTNPATNIGLTTMTLNGNINPGNLTVTSGFEYGLTTSYGTSVAGVPATVTSQQDISANITGLAMNTLYHYRATGTSGSLVVNGGDMTFTTAGPPVITTTAATIVGATFATMNGTANANNDNTTLSFEYGTTPAYGSTADGVPPTVSGNTTTNFNATITGLTINTTYYYRAVGVNGGGTTYGVQMTFYTTCVVPPAPGAISGPSGVCKNGTGYVYSVEPVPYAFVYLWTFPVGFTITSYPNSNTVTVDVSGSAVSGIISVRAQSDCGAIGNPSNLNVTVNNLPTPNVTGNSPVCQSASNDYTTEAGMSNYQWTASPDGTITPSTNPQVVSISWPTTGAKTVGVVYTNPSTGCTAASPGILPVIVNAAPVPTISGTSSLCVNSGYYYYSTEAGKTSYVWGVSSGGTIVSGQGTSTVEINWTLSGAQYVTVNYNNSDGCSAPSPTVYDVTVEALPEAAGSITGTSGVCEGESGIAYSVATITGATTYVWTLPAGATIATGDGTNAITVDFAANASSGNITVYGNSLCGNGTVSPDFPVTVTLIPADAGTITGPVSVCAGSVGVAFSVPPISGATGYDWILPPGATIASGDNTENITVDFADNAVSGNITVAGTNSCGTGTVSPNFSLTVIPKPAAPVITIDGIILSSNYVNGNQWFYNGAPITGGTAQTQLAEYSGWYWDVVTVDGCESDTSNNIYVNITGIDEPLNSRFVVYPVPNDGHFTLQMYLAKEETFDANVYNSIGASIYMKKDIVVKGQTDMTINLSPLPTGIYTIVMRNSEHRIIRKFMVNK